MHGQLWVERVPLRVQGGVSAAKGQENVENSVEVAVQVEVRELGVLLRVISLPVPGPANRAHHVICKHQSASSKWTLSK